MAKENKKEITEISERISEMLSFLGETKNAFATKLGYKRAQTIYDITDGKSAPSYDFFRKFQISEYSDVINVDWLITGRTPMLKAHTQPSTNLDQKGAPYYNVDFIGGFDLIFNDQTTLPAFYIDFTPYNTEGVIWCNLTGHSMEPELSNGDIIALKELTTPIAYLPAGEIYGIVTDEYRTVKRMAKSPKEGYVRLIPTNHAPEYSEQEIPISMIIRIYAVLGSIRKFF